MPLCEHTNPEECPNHGTRPPPPPPSCQICGWRAHIYWAPFTLSDNLRVEPVMPDAYGMITLCAKHKDGLIEAVQGWLDGLDIRPLEG